MANEQRSSTYTELAGNPNRTATQFIDFHNPDGNLKLLLDDKLREQASNLLRSGICQVIVPARNELQFGAYPGVLEYLTFVSGKENILVIDADSTDGTGDYARENGIECISQSQMEQAYDLERIANDFGVNISDRPGKGRTMLAGLMYQRLVQSAVKPEVRFNILSDADITNPSEFNHPLWLAAVASGYNLDDLLEVRAAQANRNNQSVMDTLHALALTNPTMKQYYQMLREYKWLLTGQFMKAVVLMQDGVNALGYGTEAASNLSTVDMKRKTGKHCAQVTIPIRCEDGANTKEKEDVMMQGIGAAVVAMNEVLFRRGIKLQDMTPADYRELNRFLDETERDNGGLLTAVSISEGSGPNTLIDAKPDRFVPPVAVLVDNGYVDMTMVQQIRNRQYGQRWNGINF